MINKSWDNFIKSSKHYANMVQFINNENCICPIKENVFRFMENDLHKVKCIILGMDPYPSSYFLGSAQIPVATGRAFEVANIENFTDRYKQQSLSNIFKALCFYKFKKKFSISELRDEKLVKQLEYINIHHWFDEMEKEGVLFLNSTLTTTMGASGAHIKIWTDFMDELIRYIDGNVKCKWLIWGADALNRVKDLVDKRNIIYSCHPASRQNNDFVESCCFNKVKGINWF